jgi:putative addiction module antidote
MPEELAMQSMKLRKIGNSLGVLLPKEIQERLHVAEGDTLYLTDTPDGIRITAHDPEFADAMEAFEQTRRGYRNALKELAK